MKKIFTLSAFLYFTNCLLGQQLPINVSYFGENGLHSGLKLGVEKSIFEKEKTKDRWFENRNSKIGSKTKIRNLVLSPSVGFYNHANNHTGLFLNAEFLYRRTKTRRGFYYDACFGLATFSVFTISQLMNLVRAQSHTNMHWLDKPNLCQQFLRLLAKIYSIEKKLILACL